MTEQELFRRLSELSDSDDEGLRKLANEISFQCREPTATVLAEWVGGPPQRRTPCAYICSNLKELSVSEMLRRTDAVEPSLRVHLMDMVVTQQLAFRELMLTALEPLLQDLTSAGTSDSASELRTCDVAYLLVRKIVRVKVNEAEHFSAEDRFKTLGPDQRDKEIDKWVLSETWKEIFPEP